MQYNFYFLFCYRGMTRLCSEDTVVKGVSIPKGARVFVNGLALHNDPELWGPEPVEQFVPER